MVKMHTFVPFEFVFTCGSDKSKSSLLTSLLFLLLLSQKVPNCYRRYQG